MRLKIDEWNLVVMSLKIAQRHFNEERQRLITESKIEEAKEAYHNTQLVQQLLESIQSTGLA